MRKTMKRKGADTRSAARHMLRAIRGLTHEISVLRRYILELRAQGHGYTDGRGRDITELAYGSSRYPPQ